MTEFYDLLGIGVGPSNLSLAALLEKAPDVTKLFLERKECFNWHPEIMFTDSVMQTSYLKDLVTPVDPTSSYSFLNFLVENDMFYPFVNTRRSVISRKEYEQYCSWVSEKLGPSLRFGADVHAVRFSGSRFLIESSKGTFESRDLCVATGLTPRLPSCARDLIGPSFLHAKTPTLLGMNFEGRSVTVVGGGQTGVEIFRNALNGKWGRPTRLNLVTSRKNLEPLDESEFTNEYFTPNYVNNFWQVRPERKAEIVAAQKLASDGNTPAYLTDLYNDLYRLRYVEKDARAIGILACRELVGAAAVHPGYRLTLDNTFSEEREEIFADIVILATGFEACVPKALEPLLPRLSLDSRGRFNLEKSYSVSWDGPKSNRIYALNFSRHQHGIIDPQSSLMAWRSAVVINDLTRQNLYKTAQRYDNFVHYSSAERLSP